MRTVVQISDLHFGAILEPTLASLRQHLTMLKPDLTIVSGDLTQRASREQFREARDYLSTLPSPQLVIPGNHDIPLYNVFRRFLSPLAAYEEIIGADHAPSFIDNEIAVVGINSARSFTFKGGTLGREQVEATVRKFDTVTGNHVRIVFTHHPFDIPVALSGVSVVIGARQAVQALEKCKVDFYLTGHLHQIHRAKASEYAHGYNATFLGAGTATSTRARGEPNSFFVFYIDHTRNDDQCIVVETHSWNAAKNKFEVTDTRSLPRVSGSTLHQGHGSGITA